MRHRKGYNRLGRDPIHRRALLKNLIIALVKNERIMTTLPKARELRRAGDKMITLAKRDTENARWKTWNWLRNPDLVNKLHGPLRERFLLRPGGYTRVLKAPNRKGDNAPMAMVEYIDNRYPPLRCGRDSLLSQSKITSCEFDDSERISSAFADLDLNKDQIVEERTGKSDAATIGLPHKHEAGSEHHCVNRNQNVTESEKDTGTPV